MQANILHAALELFAEHGGNGVSMRTIAAAAAVTTPLIYHYFTDKQAVYDAAVQHALAYMTERMIDATRSGVEGEARLHAFLTALVDLQASDAPEVRLVDRELMEARPQMLTKVGADLFQRPHEALAEIIRGLAPTAPAAEIAQHVIAATYGMVKLRSIRTRLAGVEQLRETAGMADSLCRFTLAALHGADLSG